MALRVDPSPSMQPWAVAILLIGFMIYIVNGIGQFFTLTAQQVAVVGFVAFFFTGLATFLTTMEEGGQTPA